VKVKFSADPRLAMPVSPKARCPTRQARRLCPWYASAACTSAFRVGARWALRLGWIWL